MNDLAQNKKMTLRQIARATGASYRTVAAYAQKAGWTKNGKTTWLDEKQVTIILEAMKQAQHNQKKDTLQAALQGVETTQSRAVRIAVLAQRQQEIEWQIKAEMQAEIDELRHDLSIANRLIDCQASGLETIQRIAEAGGLIMSDRDDINSMYRRRQAVCTGGRKE
jgi:hypothetical protein